MRRYATDANATIIKKIRRINPATLGSLNSWSIPDDREGEIRPIANPPKAVAAGRIYSLQLANFSPAAREREMRLAIPVSNDQGSGICILRQFDSIKRG